METKNCPFCGEEVLATAKKCKHCGEWLETTSATKKIIRSKPNYVLLSWMCYIAMFVEVISCIQEMGLAKGDYHIRGLANLIPEWFVVICGGFLFVYLLFGLRKHYMLTNADKPNPFIALICLSIILYIFNLMMTLATEDAELGITILMIPVLISCCILEFIVGFKLNKRFEKDYSFLGIGVGIALMLYAVVPVIVMIFGLILSDNEEAPWWSYVIASGIYIFLLNELNALFKEYES